ncbi:hypothetical protein BXZ70DRAFT_770333 [Cristinia sonorae]|uniref:Uncharacterized protein n=1 Tax=Cristinia sonorae TaxID=1940300 RepID=A0A8K0UTT8_9AGAR|nr:hypothetical protein BXZ70DRAFT_770333 [Cristinia sonorae]
MGSSWLKQARLHSHSIVPIFSPFYARLVPPRAAYSGPEGGGQSGTSSGPELPCSIDLFFPFALFSLLFPLQSSSTSSFPPSACPIVTRTPVFVRSSLPDNPVHPMHFWSCLRFPPPLSVSPFLRLLFPSSYHRIKYPPKQRPFLLISIVHTSTHILLCLSVPLRLHHTTASVYYLQALYCHSCLVFIPNIMFGFKSLTISTSIRLCDRNRLLRFRSESGGKYPFRNNLSPIPT